MTTSGEQVAYLTEDELRNRLRDFPKVSIANLPTPLEAAPRLRAALGDNAPRILVKRDDLTGFSFGGNKARHVEYRLPDIQNKGADTLVLANPAQSNNVRVHAALGAKFGFDTFIVKVPSNKDDEFNGNLMLDQVYGAQIVPPSSNNQKLARTQDLDALINRLTAQGRNVYDVNRDSFSRTVPPLSYMQATLELATQLDELGVEAAHIFMAGSSSVSGMILAAKLLGKSFKVHPVSVRDDMDEYVEGICKSAKMASDALELSSEINTNDFVPHVEYIGPEWGIATQGCMEALRLAARTEALILDPVFTAKAMHALIDQIKTGQILRDETAVFVHSGGQPIIFAYSDEIQTFESELETS